MEKTLNGIKFGNIYKDGGISISDTLIQSSFNENSDIPSNANFPLVNAVDIDWNGAEIDSNTTINTTGDLLTWIKNKFKELQQSINTGETPGGATDPQGPTGNTGEPTVISVDGVSVFNSSINTNVGNTVYLTAVISPANATNKRVRWTSSNTDIAVISNTTADTSFCIINTLSVGQTTITVKTEDGNYIRNINLTVIDPSENAIDSFQEFVNKYDFDGDGIISIIDLNIIIWITTGVITSADPKYDSVNGTYNGKSLDLNNDGDSGDIADAVKLGNLIANKINQYFKGDFDMKYQEQVNDIKSYYQNHNYKWPTLEQVEYFKNNGEWEELEPKIKLISEEDFNAAAYIKYGLTQPFGYYENGTSRLGIPMSSYNDITSQSAIMFDNFYWKNNYTENKVTKNGIECVAYEQWTTRGIGFKNLIIDSTVPVFFGMHVWGNGYWQNTIVYVNDELVESYVTLFGDDAPEEVRPLSEYNINNASTANWWLTY